MNINIGGTKKWNVITPEYKKLWTVMDIAGKPDILYNINSRELFPLKDNVVNNYYTSHTLEHIKPWIVLYVLREMYRTLKPGGLIYIIVPDFYIAMQKYMEKDFNWFIKNHGRKRIKNHYPNTMLGHLTLWYCSSPHEKIKSGHNSAFDWETLKWYVNEAGFKNIKQREHDKCSKIFKGLSFKKQAKTSLYLEAEK